MNNFTSLLGKVTAFVCLNLAVCFTAFGQSNPVSLSSTPTPAGWVPVGLGITPLGNNVTIKAGDTIAIDQTANCSKLIIEKGATLNSSNTAASGQLNLLQPGAGITIDTLQNDGVLGAADGTADGILLVIPQNNTNFKLMGSGTTAIGAIRPLAHNSNLTVDIYQNVSLNNSGIAFSALPVSDTGKTVDNITFHVDTNKTVALTNPHSKFHGSQASATGGQYVYNLNGTLDMGATTDTTSVIAGTGSSVNVSINNKMVLGQAFASSGTVAFNIADGAMVDATNTAYLNTGINYFTTNGSAVLKRKVDNNFVVFPVGAPGSSTYSPIALTNKGSVTNFSVSVKNQFDTPVPNSNTVVNKQWTVKPDQEGVSNVTVAAAWLTADQAAGFKPNGPIAMINNSGADWSKGTTATVTGNGTLTNPYIASAADFTTFGEFVVENGKALPVNVNVYPNPVSSVINVSFAAATSNGTISIATTSGKKVIISGVSSGSTSWNANIADWSSGIYVITLDNGGKKYSTKFIKL